MRETVYAMSNRNNPPVDIPEYFAIYYHFFIEIVSRVIGCIYHMLRMTKELGYQVFQKGVNIMFLFVLHTKGVAVDVQNVWHRRPLRLEYRP